MKHSKKGFTLVELIVVATILTILATVGFISYESYLVDTRDSKRLAQLTGLRDGLRLGITKGQLPLPDDSVEIRNSGTPFLYQGYAGENVLESISYSEATKDPFDDTYYTYLLSRNRKDFQVLGFLEEYNPDVISGFISETNAIDYSQRFPQTMGKKLGVVLQKDTNTPLQEIPEYSTSGFMDLQDTTTNQFDAYITDSYIISGKERDLIGIIPFTTCKKILENGDSYGNGIYNINPSGLNPFEAYCDMETDGGGWTLVARNTSSGIGDFGWFTKTGNIRDDSLNYSLGSESVYINFSEILFGVTESSKTMSAAVSFIVNSQELTQRFSSDNTSETVAITACREIFTTLTGVSPCVAQTGGGSPRTPRFIGKFGINNSYYWSWDSTDIAGYRSDLISSSNSSYGYYGGEHGMIFVR